jgi:hypothetical protein
MWPIKVSQAGGSYYYQIGDCVSARRYADSQSAWHDARRPQRIRPDGRIEPAIELEEIVPGVWATSAEMLPRR